MRLSDVGGIVCYQMIHRDGTREAADKCSKSLCVDCLFSRFWIRVGCVYGNVPVMIGRDMGLVGEEEFSE